MAAAGANLLANTMGIGSFGLLESLPFILATLKLERETFAYTKKLRIWFY